MNLLHKCCKKVLTPMQQWLRARAEKAAFVEPSPFTSQECVFCINEARFERQVCEHCDLELGSGG